MAGMAASVRGQNMAGGEGGIRTPDTRKGMPDFESGAFNRALPPLHIHFRIGVIAGVAN